MAAVRTMNLDCGRNSYRWILQRIIESGVVRSPRGLQTRDLGHVNLHFIGDLTDMLPVEVGRSLSTRIAAIEALQLIAGLPAERLLLRVASQFARYARPNGTFWGSYGRRIGQQLNAVAAKLQTDPDTRQAVITLWNPELDNRPGELDYPCTVSLQFSIDPGTECLNMITTMRSNDAWLGLPYDLFQFTQLQLTLARALNREPGSYTHTTWSLHLYEENVVDAERVTTGSMTRTEMTTTLKGIGRYDDPIYVVRDRAAAILTGVKIAGMTESEEWYVEQLADYFKL